MEDYSCRFDRTRDRRWDFRLRAAGQDGRGFGPRWWPSAEDISALSGARIAALHAGLKLNAEQEKNWPPVEAALRDLAEQRADCSLRASADRATDLVERLNLRADTMTQRGAALKKLTDAARPLYKSLDNGQRDRMVLLVRLTGAGFEGERSPHHHRSWMMGHRGFGSGGAGGWFDGGQRPQ